MSKLIISLSKDPSANYYRIRPGAISVAVIGLLGFAVFMGLIGMIRGTTDFDTFSPFLIIIGVYVFLFLFEVNITLRKMNKAFIKV